MWPFKHKAAPIAVRHETQSRPAYWQPYQMAESYLPTPDDLGVLKVLRQAIPILDIAVDRLVRLTGNAVLTWESARVQTAWDEWQASVSVPPLLRGFNTSLNGVQSRGLMFGTGVREIAFDEAGRQVKAFRFIATDTVRLRQDPEDPFEVIVAQTQAGQMLPVVLERQFIDIFAHDPRDDSPYCRSIFADCPFVGELLLAVGDVLPDAVSRHVLEGPRRRDVTAVAADDDHQLDLPVDERRGERHVGARARETARELREDHRLGGRGIFDGDRTRAELAPCAARVLRPRAALPNLIFRSISIEIFT
jgi:hypothetical protein